MGVVFDNVVRISANVTGDFGNVTGLRSGAELRGEDGRKGLVLTGQAGACTYRLAFGPRAALSRPSLSGKAATAHSKGRNGGVLTPFIVLSGAE